MNDPVPLNLWLDYGVDIRRRRIFLHGDVDEGTIAYATRGLLFMAAESDDPVTLFISSYGGSIDETFVLYDVLQRVSCHVTTVALGFCMSAAPLLLAAGHTRLASENCDFMLHTASFEVEGSLSNVEAASKAVHNRCVRMDKLMALHSSMPYRHWKKFTEAKADVYFDARQAQDWGLIDGIWQDFI